MPVFNQSILWIRNANIHFPLIWGYSHYRRRYVVPVLPQSVCLITTREESYRIRLSRGRRGVSAPHWPPARRRARCMRSGRDGPGRDVFIYRAQWALIGELLWWLIRYRVGCRLSGLGSEGCLEIAGVTAKREEETNTSPTPHPECMISLTALGVQPTISNETYQGYGPVWLSPGSIKGPYRFIWFDLVWFDIRLFVPQWGPF